jgi:chromosome segregation ATPase
MSQRAVATSGSACALLAAVAVAYLLVGGLPGVLYGAGILMAGSFMAMKLGVLGGRTDSENRRWTRKSVVISELRSALEDREQHVEALEGRLDQEAREARHAQSVLEARIAELERTRGELVGRLDEERARVAEFLDELTGGLGQRGSQLEALDRELTALVSD